MQHELVALQLEKSSSYSILTFVISLTGCPGPSPLPRVHATAFDF